MVAGDPAGAERAHLRRWRAPWQRQTMWEKRLALWRVPHFVFHFVPHLMIVDFDDFSDNCQKNGR